MGNTRARLLLALLVTAVGVLAIFLVLDQPPRPAAFWYRLAWGEFLVLLIWGTVIGFVSRVAFGRASATGPQGSQPAVVVTVVVYACLSFLGLVAQALLPPDSLWQRLHLAFQIAILAAMIVLVVALGVAARSQSRKGD